MFLVSKRVLMGIAEQEAIDYNPVHTLLKKEGHLPFESENQA